ARLRADIHDGPELSSNQRSDTLMQDRSPPFIESSCYARPDHTFGSETDISARPPNVRYSPKNRHYKVPLTRSLVRTLRANPRVSALPHLAAVELPMAVFRWPPVKSSDLTGIRRLAIRRCSTDLQ